MSSITGWSDTAGIVAKIKEETSEVEAALADNDDDAVDEELGDLLFSVVNVSRFLKVDAEQALTASTDKFIRRFEQMEELAEKRGLNMDGASLEEWDALWNDVKRSAN